MSNCALFKSLLFLSYISKSNTEVLVYERISEKVAEKITAYIAEVKMENVMIAHNADRASFCLICNVLFLLECRGVDFYRILCMMEL